MGGRVGVDGLGFQKIALIGLNMHALMGEGLLIRGLRVWVLGLEGKGLAFRVLGSGFWVLGLGFRDAGSRGML